MNKFNIGDQVRLLYHGKHLNEHGVIVDFAANGVAVVRLNWGRGDINYKLTDLERLGSTLPAPAENPMTCELRVGDLVEVVLKTSKHEGETFKVERAEKGKNFRLTGATWEFSQRSSLKLIARAGAPVQATPKEQASTAAPVLKKDEFSERGVLPSDVAGINEMVKRMFKEKRDETKPAPAKPPSHAGLLVVASERCLGLGYNDEMGAP